MENKAHFATRPDSTEATRHKATTPAPAAAALLDRLLVYLGLHNDACLAQELGVPPFAISKLRSGTATIDADMLIRMHEASGFAISELRSCMGDHRHRFHS